MGELPRRLSTISLGLLVEGLDVVGVTISLAGFGSGVGEGLVPP